MHKKLTPNNMKVFNIAVLRQHVNRPFGPVARQAELEGEKFGGWGVSYGAKYVKRLKVNFKLCRDPKI